jgi:hypothetical protein
MRRAVAVGEIAAFALVMVQLAHFVALEAGAEASLVYAALLITESLLAVGITVGLFGARAWIAGTLVLATAVTAMVALMPAFAWEVEVISLDFSDLEWRHHLATVVGLVGSAGLGGALFVRKSSVGTELAWVALAGLTIAPALYLALFWYSHVSPWQTVENRDRAAEAFAIARLVGILCAGAGLGKLRRRVGGRGT